MANRQIDPRRMTKAERREDARRQRLEIERRIARSRKNRWIALGVAVAVVAGVGVYLVVRPKPKEITPQSLLAAATTESTAAGCTAVKDVGPYQPESEDRLHIGTTAAAQTMPPLSSYASIPPASGPHNPTPLSHGVYDSPPPIDQTIHSLEHGAAIIWYAPDASGPELDEIKSFFRKADVGSRVIVAPYDYPDQGVAGKLPGATQMALVAWHHVETCTSVNLAAAFGFTAHYMFPAFGNEQYKGDAPEPGGTM